MENCIARISPRTARLSTICDRSLYAQCLMAPLFRRFFSGWSVELGLDDKDARGTRSRMDECGCTRAVVSCLRRMYYAIRSSDTWMLRERYMLHQRITQLSCLFHVTVCGTLAQRPLAPMSLTCRIKTEARFTLITRRSNGPRPRCM